MRPLNKLFVASIALFITPAFAHDTGVPHHDPPVTAVPLPFVTETKGPVRLPKQQNAEARTSGQGFWTFAAAPEKVPVPPEAVSRLKGAHGTLLADPASDTVFWGLQDIGWIAFTERLGRSAVVEQDEVFKKGNLHGADILPRRGRPALIAAADNVNGEVYLSEMSFRQPRILKFPELEPYADGKGYAPTDVAFEGRDRLWITDGYGKAWFMPADVQSGRFLGQAFGGKSFSATPHGITYNSRTHALIVSARPEGLLKNWNPKEQRLNSIAGLPPGSTVCDVDLWGDYALAPCLDGPGKSPGPIYVINLKKKAIVSTIKPKTDLGFEDAQHIHDACWYFTGRGRNREVYVLFTSWNPGGIGALKLVSAMQQTREKTGARP